MITNTPQEKKDTYLISASRDMSTRQLSEYVQNFKQIDLSRDVRDLIERSYTYYKEILGTDAKVYGDSTGFGPFVKFGANEAKTHNGKYLLAHLGAGSGNDTPNDVVKAAMILRLNTIAAGHSGTNPALVDAYLTLLKSDFTPSVPITGSVGASGDLIPMASIAGILVGYGKASDGEASYSANEVLNKLQIDSNLLEFGRDALSLVNCTSYSTAWASLAVERALTLIQTAEVTTAHLMALVGAQSNSLQPDLHSLKGHTGQIDSARNILNHLNTFNAPIDDRRSLQEVYSIRCVPQIIGASRDQINYAKSVIEQEINSVNDNPIVGNINASEPEHQIFHGGNFFGQHVAFASDALNSAITQVGLLVERQIDLMVTPSNQHKAPLLLSWDEGKMSGLAGLQIGASALVAEMRAQCQSYATTSIPTNAGNQDIVPMAANAARQAYYQTERLSTLLAKLCMSISQLNHLIKAGKAEGNSIEINENIPHFQPLYEDRPVRDEIAAAADQMLKSGYHNTH